MILPCDALEGYPLDDTWRQRFWTDLQQPMLFGHRGNGMTYKTDPLVVKRAHINSKIKLNPLTINIQTHKIILVNIISHGSMELLPTTGVLLAVCMKYNSRVLCIKHASFVMMTV